MMTTSKGHCIDVSRFRKGLDLLEQPLLKLVSPHMAGKDGYFRIKPYPGRALHKSKRFDVKWSRD